LPGGKQLGGAPANFAYHAHALGAYAWPVTRVGIDSNGLEILERLQDLGLATSCVQLDPGAPTGTVSVEMLANGQHRFTIHENVAWDRMEATEEALALASAADILCFGTLGQRCETSRGAIQQIASAAPARSLRIFDINLRQHFYSQSVIEKSLSIASVLKVNDEELPVICEMLRIGPDPATALVQLAERFELKVVALTRGSHGSLLYSDGRTSDFAGIKVEVVDSIGAGDAFTAAMALGFLRGWDLDTIGRRANEVAAYVCTQAGATPAMPASLTEPFAVS